MTTTVLHLGAGALMADSIRRLQAAGFTVHALDGNAQAEGLRLATRGAAIDFSDVAAVIADAERHPPDLILGVNEPGVFTAAVASDRLGLPNVPLEVAWRCLHKGRMRLAWAEAGLPQPPFRLLDRAADLPAAVAELGFPAIVKPTIGWGSWGVATLRAEQDLAPALEMLEAAERRSFDRRWLAGAPDRRDEDRSRAIVERYVEGTELTVEGLVVAGEARVLVISDKEHQEHPRYRVAMALNYPAAIPAAARATVERTIAGAVDALGLRAGAFHAECMLTAGGEVALLELGARGGGGHIFGLIVELATGVVMPVATVRLLLGERPPEKEIAPRHARGVCYRFFQPPPGVYRGLSGLEEARRLPGVAALGFTMAPGARVEPIAEDRLRPGFVVAHGADRDTARARADAAIARLVFDVENDQELSEP